MKKLYQALDRIEAQMLKDHLENAGVESVILGDFLAGAAGELPANLYPEIWLIDDDDTDRAGRLLQEFTKNRQQNSENGPWCCPNCGEWIDAGFDICWNCAAPRKGGS